MFERLVLNSLVKTDKDRLIQEFLEEAVLYGDSLGYGRYGNSITYFNVRHADSSIYFYARKLVYAKARINGDFNLDIPDYLFTLYEQRLEDRDREKQEESLDHFIKGMSK